MKKVLISQVLYSENTRNSQK